ncbi:uncharacterized protein LOC110247158 [Exaiptasia diaphana]|uniref:Peptidase S1 domain-containing protein n=1 Tax=Exaiptasia diaphana TaxID=2652724 RepID=A0A913XSV8_EXADI|nr:uncharacterized protein LOC110247158 [Exaiptasia diaphana]
MMASAKARRISKARKFLQGEEVHLILNEENSLKNLLSTFPIDDDLKKKISKDPNSIQALKSLDEYSKGVCQIIVTSPDSNHSHCGNGFFIGDGWVLTTANIVRNRNQVNHARFTFTSNDETFTFEARERRAFVYRTLQPGRRPDYHNRDITLIKLGVQFSFRQDVAPWERDEQALLAAHPPFSFQNLSKQGFLPPSSSNSVQSDDTLCTVYHGEHDKHFHVGFQASQPYKVFEPAGVLVYEFYGGFNAEASGCPVFVFKNGQCFFLGVFVPGPSSKSTGCKAFTYNGQALVWDEEFLTHISAGIKAVDKMSNIKSYSLAIPFDERKKLLNERTVYQAAELALNHRVLIL